MKNDDDVTFRGLFLPLTTKKVIVFIFIIGLIVFFNSLFNGFVGDDDSQIVKNITVHSVSNIPQFFTGGTFYNGSARLIGVYYKPLLTSMFAIIFSTFGDNPFMFHLIQVFFHILNSCILFLFLSRFFKKNYSFLLSLIFLIHPIQSEAVLYISAMQEILFFFFGILAMYLTTALKTNRVLGLIFVLLILALFSKETGILFIFVTLVFLFLFNKKFFLPGLFTLIFVPIVYLFLRTNSIGLLTLATNSPIDKLNLPLRLLNAPQMTYFYLNHLFWPADFAITYQWAYRYLTFDHFLVPLIIDSLFIGAILAGAYFLRKNSSEKYFKLYVFFAAWFGIGLIFHLQIFPLDQTVADRWFYFPIVGLLGMGGVILEVFKVSLSKYLILLPIMIVLVGLSLRTIVRGYDFKDSLTLYTHDASVSKNSFALESVLGLELMKRGELLEAKPHIEKSVALYPYFSNLDNLGELYVGLGDYKKARQAYLKALTYGDYYIIYEDMAGLALVSGDYQSNAKFILNALKKFPKDSKLWLYLAIISYQNNNTDLAKQAITNAYLFDKSNPEIPNIYNAIINDQKFNLKINSLPQ